MPESEELVFDIKADITQATREFKDFNNVLSQSISALYGTMALMRRMGLPESQQEALRDLMRIISLLNMARTSILALQAASGPIGWAMAGIGLLGTALTASEFFMEV